MPRRAHIVPYVKLTTKFPEEVRAKLDLFLWSEVEGRVPEGAIQRFLLERIREFFESETLEVVPGQFVRGSRSAIAMMKEYLRR